MSLKCLPYERCKCAERVYERRMGHRDSQENDAKFNPKPAKQGWIRRAFILPFCLDTGHVKFLFICHRVSGCRARCKHLSGPVLQSSVYS